MQSINRPNVMSNSSALGQLLLRGWTMLADSCPEECQVPLMRDPATMLGHCVCCHKVFDSDGNYVQTNGILTANGTGSSTPSSSPGPSPGSSSIRHSPHAASQAAAPSLPSTATTAADTPTPTANDDGSNREQQAQQQDPEQQQLEGSARQEEPDYRELYRQIREQRQRREASGPDTTQILADKLVAGWGMLAHTCPLCAHPLLRNRSTGAIHCAICDLPVQIESRAGSGQTAATGHNAAAAGQALASASTAAAAAADPGSLPSSGAAAGIPSTASDQQQVLQRLQRVLLTQLDQVGSLIEGCSPTAGREALKQHLELAQSLLGTLAAARAASGQPQQ